MKRIVRLTESDLTRIVRRVIMEQATIDPTISQALDNLQKQFESMMGNIVKQYPNLSQKATEAKTSLETYINKAKNLQLVPNDAETSFGPAFKLLTLGGKGGYKPYEKLRKLLFTDLKTLETKTGYLNQSYDVNKRETIKTLINGVSNSLKSLVILK